MKLADLQIFKMKTLGIICNSAILISLVFGLSKQLLKPDTPVAESMLAPLSVMVTSTPTTGVYGQELTYNITVISNVATDTHTVISVTGLIPPGTSIVPGSVMNVSGHPAIISNSSLPVWTLDTLSGGIVGKNTTSLSYRVLINSGASSPILNTISVTSTLNGIPSTANETVSTNIFGYNMSQAACTCNNDNTVNLNNGTYNTRLIIRNDSVAPNPPQNMVPNLAFTILSSTGLDVPNGTLFLYENGYYYFDVKVTNPNFTISIDGPDSNPNSDLSFNGSCSGYPTIDFPDGLEAPNLPLCILPTDILQIPVNGLLSLNYPISASNPPTLPEGFSYGVSGTQLVLNINGAEIDPQESPANLYYIQNATPPDPNDVLTALVQFGLGNTTPLNNLLNALNCRVVSQRLVTFAIRNVAVINPTHFSCRTPGSPVYLSNIFGDGNTSTEGFFTVTPDGGVPSIYQADSFITTPAGGGCYSVFYTIPDAECGDVISLTVNLLITTKPAKPEFTINGSQRPAPICATTPQDVILSAPGTNESYFIPTGTALAAGPVVGTTLSLPAPMLVTEGEPVSVKYTVCKATNGGPVPACPTPPGGWNRPAEVCRDTLCKTIVLFNDGFNCGEEALFPSTCGEPFRPDLCDVIAEPGLELGCRWFSISTPPLLKAEIEFDDFAVDCSEEEVCGSYDVSLFGVSSGDAESGTTIGDFPGIGTICRVLNFKILGFRPLGAIADLLGCNKTIAEFIFDALSALLGGTGGEVRIKADSDGDGAFDLTLAQGTFPLGGDFCVPNRVIGQGYISARALASWPGDLAGDCGDIRGKEISLLELLPIGSIPIIGPTIEDILAFAGCDSYLEFTATQDAEVLVTQAKPATFANCDTTTRILYTYTGQNTTCVLPAGLWSIPVAFSGCKDVVGEVLTYKGIVALADITEPGVYQTEGPSPGDTLLPGDTVVTYTAVGCNGNYSTCTFPLRIIEADPSFEAGFICCDDQSVFLGGAGWTGVGAPPIANTIRLDAIRGRYPNTSGGTWTGQGVEFYNPDGIPFNGDEYYLFNPDGLDGSITLTYTLAGQPCEISFSRDVLVTCQDLQVSLTDQVTCPAVWVPERIILTNLDDDSITVTTSGLSNIGAAGGHYGGGPATDPVVELIDTIANDGKVVIPGFYAPAIRDTTFRICVRTYQRNQPFGCEDQFCYNIRVVDTIAPVFLNCPKEPIVVDALLGQCEAFVNFEFPIAFDSCQGFTKVTQVDTTGLKSGDLFPVGLTVLAYTTIDTVGNQNYCEIKIIVSDFRLPPRVQCPPNVAVRPNDLNMCGAVVNNIQPVSITDNCRDHVAVTYEITGPDGKQVACGFENASGNLFPIGTSTVKYTVKDQPLILITEVQQRDGFYGVEITNFGPSAVDITCGKFMLKDAAGIVLETFTIPTDNNISTMFDRPIYPPVIPILWNVRTPNNILDVGETFTHVFNGDQDGDGDIDVVNNYDRCNVRKYCFGFLDYVMDEAVVNDKIDASAILRTTVCDKDNQLDFRAANSCDTTSFGRLNPGLPVMTFRNDTVGLQHIAPSFDMCQFTVTIEDTEAPTCIWHDSIRVAGGGAPPMIANVCLTDTIVMPAGLVDDINIFNLNITTANAGAIGAYLRSPSGKRIKLFDRVCATDTLFCTGGPVNPGIGGSPDINVNLDETINKWQTAPSITTAPCNPLGGGGFFRPETSFKEFYGNQGGGNWILEIYGEEGTLATLNNWDLQILYQIPFGQKDTVMVNRIGRCDTVFSWIHPILEDNCIKGTMVVDYLFSNSVTLEKDSTRVVIANATNTVNVMGCRESRRFKVGETIVRYTLTDQYDNINQCSFKVTVNDEENPVFVPLTCYDRQIFLDPGECTGILINPPQATDNCKMDTITYCFLNAMGTDSLPANIQALPIGVYRLVAKAEDIYGNIERCPFNVIVHEFIPPSTEMACINDVNLSLDGDCNAEVTPSMLLADVNNVRCYDNYDMIVYDEKGNPRSPVFTKADEGKSFKVLVTDNKLPRVPPYNSCWGYIHIERKLGPTMKCPKDTLVYCNVDPNAKNSAGKYILGEPEVTSCEVKRTIWHEDEWISYGDCEPVRALLNRTWYLENEKGERTSCVQKVTFRKMHLDSIVFPADKLDIVCSDVAKNAALTGPENTGFPSLHGVRVNRVGGLCMVSLVYTDERFEICHGSYEILRTWKVRDMCGPVTATNPRTHVQVIKVTDKTGPIIKDCPSDITVSVGAWECLYTGALPVPKDIDATCSPNYSFSARIIGGGRVFSSIDANTLAVSARAANLRKGTYTVYYDFKDQCLNKSQCSFKVTVVDSIAPVATAKEFITVSLTKNDTSTVERGIAKIFASQVDNGSYDNCGNVYLEVRREDNAPACLNFGSTMSNGLPYNNNRSYNATINGLDQTVPLHLNDNSLDTDKGQFVKFCCEDIGKEVKIWLRVWDDASGDGVFGNAGDNFNETWTIAKVEDKVVPKIFCKPSVEVNCDRDTGIVTEYNFTSTWVSTSGKVPNSLLPVVEGVCGNYELEFRDAGSLSVCNKGTFTRTYRVKSFTSVMCTQTINVIDQVSEPQLEWPIVLHNWNRCTLTEEDVLANTVRARINVEREFGWDGCYPDMKSNSSAFGARDGDYCSAADIYGLCKEGTGNAVQWNEDPTLPYNVIPDNVSTCKSVAGGRPGPISTNGSTPAGLPRFNSNYKDPGCNVFGKKITIEEYTVGDGCRKWFVKFDYINWCCNEKSACRETIYKYEDTTAPVITFCDKTDKDIVDASCAVSDTLRPVASDNGGCEAGLTWRVRIYPGDKSANGKDFIEIINASYDLDQGKVGHKATSTNRITGTSPQIIITNIPAGEHGVRYLVTDGCGNVTECTEVIGVWPKAATPYCVSISSAVMKNGLVELWAKDFDRGSFTNCGNGVMLFTFNRGGVAEHPAQAQLSWRHIFTGFGVIEAVLEGPGKSSDAAINAAWAKYNAGNAQLWLPDVKVTPRPTLPNGTAQPDLREVTGGTSGMQFGCKAGNNIASPIVTEMRVWDLRSFKAGTTQGSDFCSTRLSLIDNQGGCGTQALVAIGGTIATEADNPLKDVNVSLASDLPEYPISTKSDEKGVYIFENQPMGVDYVVTPDFKSNMTDGINTLDLVHIQRHILGIAKLSSPYKMIAADVDGDQAIRVNDIVTLRKLILGIDSEISNGKSWKFVNVADKMEATPWPFNEQAAHTELSESKINTDFVGVKMGDVDGSAAILSGGSTIKPRSNDALVFGFDDAEVKQGQEIEVSLYSKNFENVYGLQWTLEHKGLNIIEVNGVNIILNNDNYAQHADNQMFTLSWSSQTSKSVDDDMAVMRFKFVSSVNGKLSEILKFSDLVTNTEAYIGDSYDIRDVKLEERSLASLKFAMHQNEPNPWRELTTVKYTLPQAGTSSLKVFDVTGKLILDKQLQGQKGLNNVVLSRGELQGVTGILMYQIEFMGNTAQRKMIVIE